MNKTIFKRFIGEMRPWCTFNSHKKPSLEIWFEMEHFEILRFSGPSSGFLLSPLEVEMDLDLKYHGF